MPIPQGRNQRWSLDFASDTLMDGRRFRILCVIDDFTRECLATVADNSISGVRVARELDTLVERRGRPCMIVSDNGTELTSHAILKWQRDSQMSNGTTSSPANHNRTHSSRASSVGSATSA